jgi:hypothetical protein
MAKISDITVSGITLKAKIKLDKDEATALLDPAKVEAFLANANAADSLLLPSPSEARDERLENGVDQRIDFEKDYRN